MASYDPNTGLTPAQKNEWQMLYGGGYPKAPSSSVSYPWGYPGNGTSPPSPFGPTGGSGGYGPAGPPAGGGGGYGTGGYGGSSAPSMPSFADILASDPWFAQYKADLMAQGVSDKAGRDAAIQQSLIRYGEVPDDAAAASALGLNNKDLEGVLTPTIRELASKNTSSGMSVKARTAQAYDDTLRQVKNVLAARGALQSGETGFQLGRADQDYTRTQYDQKNSLMDYINGVQQGYVAAERQRQQALFQAQLEAMQRAYAQWGSYGYGGSSGGGGGGQAPAPSPSSTGRTLDPVALARQRMRSVVAGGSRALTPAEQYRKNQGQMY